MSFRYQKRINLGKGAGLNVSKSGVSGSYRTKHGSIGSRGFSIRTGIPGLSYRVRWGKNAGPAILIYLLVVGCVLVVYNLVRFIVFVIIWSVDRIRSTMRKV